MLKKIGLQVLVVLFGAGFFIANAQTATVGNLSGTVRDSSGAAVPKAEVMITDERTGATRTVTANDAGFYVAPSLTAGTYNVSTTPQRFQQNVATGGEVRAAEDQVLDPDRYGE